VTRVVARLAVTATFALALSCLASAGTLHGIVKNGTTGKPAAGVKVILLALQGGMQPVADAVSGAQGQFSFDNPGIGAQPMLVRAVYKDVNFHTPLPPGKNDVEVSVFEPTKDPKTVTISSRIVVFQPNGDKLLVGEEYSVENNSQPPQAYFKPDGNFEVQLPANAALQQVAAAGPSGMPVVQAPIEKKNHVVAVAFAFRPGQSRIRCSYEIPYAGSAARVALPAIYSVARLIVVAPPSVEISGDGLQPGGQEQGMNLYGRENVAANTVVNVSLSGTAAPPAEAQGAGPETGPGAGESAQGGAQIQIIPGRLDSLKWGIVLGLVAVFGLGAILLGKKQIVVNMPENGVSAVALQGSPGSAARENGDGSKPRPTASSASPSTASAISNVDVQVGNSLDALKDRLFRLELRRQAGTITEADYIEERNKAEQVLRDLVKG
jgi:hypothetical protein